jgi:heme exporter protein B
VISPPFFAPFLLNAPPAWTRALAPRPAAEAWPWLRIIIAFDIVFVVACTMAFPYTLEE